MIEAGEHMAVRLRPSRSASPGARATLAAAAAALAIAEAALGQGTTAEPRARPEADARHLFVGSADDVTSKLTDLRFDRNALTTFDPFSGARSELRKLNKKLDKAANLRVGFAWTAVYQHATESRGPEDAAAWDFDFFGRWMPLRTRSTLGYVIFETQVRDKFFTDIAPSDLGDVIGSLWPTTNGFNVQSFNVKQIYWQQFLLKNTFTYRIGKLDQSNVFNVNRLQSANFYFLNTAFSDNQTMAYPENGFGFDLTWRPHPLVYLSYGFSNTDPGSVELTSDKFLRNTQWFTVAEVGLTPWIDGLGAGHYRLTGWFTDASASVTASDGAGFAISCDQDLGPKWIAFLRYGLGNGELTATRQIVAGGFGIRRPIGDNDDFAGIGFAWGQPSDSTLREQMVAEGFYRLQWSSAVQVTADAQLIINPSMAPEKDVIGVFGVRLRITF